MRFQLGTVASAFGAVAIIAVTCGLAHGQQQASAPQQQQQRQVFQTLQVQQTDEVQQVELASDIQFFLADGARIEILADVLAAEPATIPALTPDEIDGMRNTLVKLHTALQADSGDNMLAEVFDFEKGKVAFRKRGSVEVKKFDPQGDQSLREWVKENIGTIGCEKPDQVSIHPVAVGEELIFVNLSGMSLQTQLVAFRKVGDQYQIVSVEFISGWC